MPRKSQSHLHSSSGQKPGKAVGTHARSSDLRTASVPVGSVTGAASSVEIVRPFAGSGPATTPNRRVNLTRRGADGYISNRRTRRLRAVR